MFLTADVLGMIDSMEHFDLDAIAAGIQASDDRQLLTLADMEDSLIESYGSELERRSGTTPAFTQPLPNITQTPSSLEFSDIELARQRATLRGTSLRRDDFEYSDIELGMDALPSEADIAPLDFETISLPPTPGAGVAPMEEVDAIAPPPAGMTAAAKRRARKARVILDDHTEL